MRTLEKGKDRLQYIVNVLKKDTLDPARQEADRILSDARARAATIIEKAQVESKRIIADGKIKIEQERKIFETSLEQSCKQSVEGLRQILMKELFDKGLSGMAEQGSQDVTQISRLIEAIINSIEKDGLETSLSVVVAKSISKEKLNAVLANDIIKRIKEGSVVVGEFNGGLQIKLHEERLTLDISDKAVKELLSQYLRKDFRKVLFKV